MSFVRLIAYLNVWISIGAISFTLLTYHLFSLNIDYVYVITIGCSTLFVYNFQRYIKHRNQPNFLPTERHLWIKNHLHLIITTLVVSALACGITVFYLSTLKIILLACGGIISIFYTRLHKPGIREIPYIKIIVISFVWVYSSVLIPLWSNAICDFSTIIFALHQFILVFVLCVPFDIRDSNYDSIRLKTLPQLVGIKKSKTIANLLLVLNLALTAFFMPITWLIPELFCLIICIILIAKTKKDNVDLFYSIAVDGVFILQFLAFSALNYF